MKLNRIKEKFGANSAEEIVSMFLGLLVVVVVIGLVVNFVQRRKGSIDIPGINTFENISLNKEEGGSESVAEADGEISDSGTGNYEVVTGDNLWKIAEVKLGSGYAWKEIAQANNISNPSYLEVGQQLTIPQSEKKEAFEASVANTGVEEGKEYTVIKGDHLWKLAVAAYGDGFKWVEIWNANKGAIENPSLIEVGMVLQIPKLETSPVVE
ncbi:MAG: LysM peptidoglycan-binding domain-containing protein [Patescibacteria group bacterium]|jgi:nucleoid-associated protein YgaU